jgi:hypothetical protein
MIFDANLIFFIVLHINVREFRAYDAYNALKSHPFVSVRLATGDTCKLILPRQLVVSLQKFMKVYPPPQSGVNVHTLPKSF